MERRLAAILAADAVGYSQMMCEDEPGTLALLQKHRSEVIDPAIALASPAIAFGGNAAPEPQCVTAD